MNRIGIDSILTARDYDYEKEREEGGGEKERDMLVIFKNFEIRFFVPRLRGK